MPLQPLLHQTTTQPRGSLARQRSLTHLLAELQQSVPLTEAQTRLAQTNSAAADQYAEALQATLQDFCHNLENYDTENPLDQFQQVFQQQIDTPIAA